MKSMDLFEAIGKISSETIEKNAFVRVRKKGTADWRKWSAVAASLAVITGAGLFSFHYIGINRGSGELTDPPQTGIETGTHGGTQDQVVGIPEPEERVEIASLLLNQYGLQAALRGEQVKVGLYTAQYRNVDAVSSEILAESMGEGLEGNEGWYRVSGHEEQQYLIHNNAGEYTLWEFGNFLSEEYPYNDVLEMIYGVYSAEDICKITLVAADMDKSDEGLRMQEEIGQYEITDAGDIQVLYGILSGLTCYGNNHWDMIDYGDGDEGMPDSVRLGRYLTIETKGGAVIDSLKYTAFSGMFYEYNGVAYNRLSTQDKETVGRILRIENALSGSASDDPADISQDSSGRSEISVDENTYHEAQRYSDEIESVQAAISRAMSNGELPFVTMSGIYEDPVRIVVTVNSNEQADMEKIRAFDTADGIIEIKYIEGEGAMTE